MATAAHTLQWLVLLTSFSAVLRPIWSGRLDRLDYEGTWAGSQQSDDAGRASPVRGLNVPIWCLLVHYGSFEKRASRSAIRRMRSTGMHPPARHLLLSNGMIAMQKPLEILIDTFVQRNVIKSLRSVFLGLGLYFLILLLACQDVERQPGPTNSKEVIATSINVQGKLLTLGIKSITKPLSSDDLIQAFTAINEKIEVYFKIMKEIEEENLSLNSRIAELEKQIDFYEKERRRNNVVVFGVATEDDLNKAMDDVMFNKLTLKKCPREKLIDRAYRFGRAASHRPILIQFKNESDKKEVLRLAPKLRGTKITISDDLTPVERQTRRKIVDAQKIARSKNIKSKILRHGLMVYEEIVSLTDLEKSDWIDKYLPTNKDNLKESNESSPRMVSTLKKTCPSAPVKKKNNESETV